MTSLPLSPMAASTAATAAGAVASSSSAAILPSLTRALFLRGGAVAAAAAASRAVSSASSTAAAGTAVSSSSPLDDDDAPAATALELARGGGGTFGRSNITKNNNKADTNKADDDHSVHNDDDDDDNNNENEDGNITLPVLNLTLPPTALSTLCMALAMAVHYGAYSFARPTTLSLFTSAQTGFGGKTGSAGAAAAAYPLAMGLVSPTSLMMLLGYGGTLERLGPRTALRRSTLYCAATLGVAAGLVHYLQGLEDPAVIMGIKILPLLVGALFVFRESYVQLITSQHWSFMSSVLTPGQSSTWFAPISGLTSMASAGAGMGVAALVERLGLTGTLGTAAVMLASSTLLTESAYGISEKYGFNPAEEHDKKIAAKKASNAAAAAAATEKKESLFRKASDLFARVPVLKALFVEILASQGVSTILNVCYVTKLSSVIPDDKERAGWSGKFFAVINVVSGFLQFGVLPNIMKYIEPSTLWRLVPLIVLCFTTYLSLDKNPSLYLVAGTFLTMKAMEFSARRMLDEMVYVPLDFDSRYVGKEVIGVFGYRFGKSGTSLAVSALTSQFNFGLSELSILSSIAGLVWARCTWKLSNLVPTKAEAEEAFAKVHAKGGNKKRR